MSLPSHSGIYRNDRTTKEVFTGDLEGKKPRGRPPRSWLDNCNHLHADLLLRALLEWRN